MGLLAKFMYKPLLRSLEERSAKIAQDIENAKRSEEEARRYAEQTQKALNASKQEAIKMKDQALREADTARRHMLADAKKEYISMIDDAKKDIGKEASEAKAKLKDDIASLSTEIAKKILEKEISEKDHDKLIDESIKEIERG